MKRGGGNGSSVVGAVFAGVVLLGVGAFLLRLLAGPIGRWLGVLIPLAGIVVTLLTLRTKAAGDAADVARLDISEFNDHLRQGIASLKEFFANEPMGTEYYVPVRLYGRLKTDNPVTSPLSKKPCAAYALTVGRAKARDRRNNEPTMTGKPIFVSGTIQLVDGDDGIALLDPPIVSARRPRVAFYRPAEYRKLPRELRRILDTTLSGSSISTAGERYFYLREESVEAGSFATVFGIARKPGHEPVITRTQDVDDPRSLFITTYAPDQRRRSIQDINTRREKRKKASVRTMVAMALMSLGFLVVPFLVEAGLFSPRKVGRLTFGDTAAGVEFVVSDFVDGDLPSLSWDISAGDRPSPQPMLHEGSTVLADGSSELVVNRLDYEVESVVLGSLDAPWREGRFELAVLEEGATSGASPEAVLYVTNRSSTDVDVVVFRDGTWQVGSYWPFAAGEGTDRDHGLYLEYNSRGVNLGPGDIVAVRVGDEIVRRIPVEDGLEIEYKLGTGYLLSIEEQSLQPRRGRLFVRNTSDDTVRIRVESGLGSFVDAYWIYGPEEASESGMGSVLTRRGEAFLVSEGMVVEIGRRREQLVYRGPLGEYPYGRYNADDETWTLEFVAE